MGETSVFFEHGTSQLQNTTVMVSKLFWYVMVTKIYLNY